VPQRNLAAALFFKTHSFSLQISSVERKRESMIKARRDEGIATRESITMNEGEYYNERDLHANSKTTLNSDWSRKQTQT
jgi:hypothetical protein